MDETGERSPARPGRAKRWLKGALIAVAGAALVWLAAPTVLGGPEPSPLWTEADLPAAPARAENGWHDLDALPRSVAPLPAELRALLQPDKEGRPWVERARALRAPLVATLDSEPARGSLAVFERAIGEPRFVDACPVALGEPCRILPLLGAHRIALLTSLRRAEAGEWSSAVTLLAKTLRADIDFATTSRSLLAHRVALANLRGASELASDLFEAYRVERARAPSVSPLGEGATAALASLDAELARLDPSALDARRAVVASYLSARKAPEDVAAIGSWQMLVPFDENAPDGVAATGGWPARVLAPLLFDRGATQTEINARFTALRDAVAASAPPPSFPPKRGKPFWWLYNLPGKILLDSINMDWTDSQRVVSGDRARIEALRPGLRKLSQGLIRS